MVTFQGPVVEVLIAKLHRVTCTEANVNYVGSLTVDGEWLDASGLFEGQKVDIANLRNGERFSTYVIRGKEGSGTLCTNGAAAHLVMPGDKLIVMAYGGLRHKETSRVWTRSALTVNEFLSTGTMTREEYKEFDPKVLAFHDNPDYRIVNDVVEFNSRPTYDILRREVPHGSK
mmetsp:Transcript_14244/g.57348  ORF Transcript_14244/g.57348 Transcript_14244/m.57348 type:complete len:173 (-) Transcript_14244:355-873(-)